MQQSFEKIQHHLSAYHASCVAVSKQQTSAQITQCYALGQRHFAENYVQEAVGKIAEHSALDIVWHFIGRLQGNKCKLVAAHFSWVQTINQIEQLEKLDRFRAASPASLQCLIQVTTNNVAHEYGVALADLSPIISAFSSCQNLRLRGLMAMPPAQLGDTERQMFFQDIAEFFQQYRGQYGWDTLSMGMSDDYQLALAAGANMVRLGQALFGARS